MDYIQNERNVMHLQREPDKPDRISWVVDVISMWFHKFQSDILSREATQIDKHAVEIFRAGMTYRQNAVMYVRIWWHSAVTSRQLRYGSTLPSCRRHVME